ncbi:MAG: hypothetical protein KJO05_09010 [Bacteroidia bacterium]|nr:hypothetical protein [Bacteroidia bacterium]NNF31658.1 hypothetical protein [Flavobacteriaceae bacterium]MBT8276714.1 hypothetical protein [Bacteroidia bacterium]NNJ83162.1 hypothetical protein [Flavobacteriaceae bacterium]NNK55172.1 hypothetical protein [Flavobacteriaceae bacterium]
MFSKANLVSTLVLTIWGVGGGYLLWGILADPFFTDHVVTDGLMKDPPDMVHLIIGCLIQAFAFSSIYQRFGSGSYGAGSGLSMGIWIAIMVGLGEGLVDFATSNILDLHGTFVNCVIYLIFFGIMGLLAGLIYGKMARPTTA